MIAFAWILAMVAASFVAAAALRLAVEILLDLAARHDIGRRAIYAASFAATWVAVLATRHAGRQRP